MRRTTWIMAAALFALAACGGGSGGVTSPGGGGGPVGDVTVGNDFFRSAHNGTQNPAVDTIAAGSTVTWAWNAAGSHSIQSTGVAPEIFRNSVVMSGANDSYAVTFNTPGTYTYDCAVHGAAMTGRIVVQ
jgi:plastocyanin